MAIKRKDIRDILGDDSLESDAKVKKILDLIHDETDSLRDANEDLQKQLDTEKANVTAEKNAREKAEKDYTDLKNSQTAKETRTAKEAAVREYFKGKGISEKSMTLAIRSSGSEIDGIELDSNGKIKATKALDDLLTGDLSSLVGTTGTNGAQTHTPPAGSSGGGKMSKEDIMKISDTAARQKAIADNHELFGF